MLKLSHRLLFAASVACAALAAPFAHAETAVLVVEDASDALEPARSIRAARDVAARLGSRGVVVLSPDNLRIRMTTVGFGVRERQDDLERKLRAAQALGNGGDVEAGLDALRVLLNDCLQEPRVTPALLALQRKARLAAVMQLIALAGSEETGKAESAQGKEAVSLLAGALHADPSFDLSPAEYPPKVLRLLGVARAQVRAAPRAGLFVDSTPHGARVFLEGRQVGVTPLQSLDVAPAGLYRVWVEHEERRSQTRWVQLDHSTARLEFDVLDDHQVWPDGPGLLWPKGAALSDDAGQHLAGLLGVDRIVLVGLWQDGDSTRLFAASATAKTAGWSKASFADDPAGLDAATAFLVEGTAPLLGSPLPAAMATPSIAETGEAPDLTWLYVTGGAVAASAVVALGVWAALPKTERRPGEPQPLFYDVAPEPSCCEPGVATRQPRLIVEINP